MDVTTRGPARAQRVGHLGTGLVLVAVGVLLLVEVLGDGPTVASVGPWLLLLAGAVAVASGLAGGREGDGVGLVVFGGVVLSAVLLVGQGSGLSPTSGLGERYHAPTTATWPDDGYHLLAGEQVVDLRGLELGPGVHRLEASVGLGSLEVLLPDEVAVVGTARAGTGSVEVLGSERGGVGVEVAIERTAREGAPRLELELRTWTGEVVVR